MHMKSVKLKGKMSLMLLGYTPMIYLLKENIKKLQFTLAKLHEISNKFF
jgi:ethanolamine transporter EutH